jgi:hypothetical protein
MKDMASRSRSEPGDLCRRPFVDRSTAPPGSAEDDFT